MSRHSTDEYRAGRVWTGFDYKLQVWVRDGVIQDCGHPAPKLRGAKFCCNAAAFAGRKIAELPADRVTVDMFGGAGR